MTDNPGSALSRVRRVGTAVTCGLVVFALGGGGSSAATNRPLTVRSSAVGRSRRTSGPAVYDQKLTRLSATFGRASSEFSALANGAAPAEVGAAAPVFAAAAAGFEHSLSKLHAPRKAASTQSRLETKLKRLSAELTALADDSESGDLAGARKQLTTEILTDESVSALVERLVTLTRS